MGAHPARWHQLRKQNSELNKIVIKVNSQRSKVKVNYAHFCSTYRTK